MDEAKRTNEAWQATFDSVSDFVMILDDSYKILNINEAALNFLQLSPEQALGKSCFEFMHHTSSPPEICPFRRMEATRKREEAEIYLEDRRKWVFVAIDPILDHSGRITGVIHIVRDITGRKEAEESLRRSEQGYQVLFDESPNALLDIDGSAVKAYVAGLLRRGVADLKRYFSEHKEEEKKLLSLIRINDVNKAALALYRVPDKSAFIENHINFFDRNFIDTFYEQVESLEAGEKRFEKEVVKMTADGEKFYAYIRMVLPEKYEKTAERILVSIVDVTARKRAEEALAESEAKYRVLVENSHVGVFIVQDDLFRYVNKRWCEITGYSYDEVVDKMNPLDIVVLEDKNGIENDVKKGTDGVEQVLTREFTTITKDGRHVVVKAMGNTIMFRGRPAGSGSIIDITRERMLEEQLHQAQKMEAIGTLAGGIAHDFNNLLMTIMGYTSLMLMETGENDPRYEKLKIVEEQIRSGAELTKQLLGFARGGKYEIKASDLNKLVNKSAELFGRTKKEITVHKKFGNNLWVVEVDRRQIEQVLLNLFVNAWQAMPGGGDIYLETSNVAVDINDKGLSVLDPGKYAKISVTDTGVGMDETTQQRIFEPFFTTKEMGRGSGLGLASAYGIIKNHGGTINVYSEKGKGTTFNIYLPATDSKVFAGKEGKQPSRLLRGSETILLVDDQDGIISVGRDMLKTLGYTVFLAGTGKEAVTIYEANKEKIDLVILDMIMPGMDGEETYKKLKGFDPCIKVILSSGYSIEGQARRILDSGCNGFIQKPFNVIELSGKIREILE